MFLKYSFIRFRRALRRDMNKKYIFMEKTFFRFFFFAALFFLSICMSIPHDVCAEEQRQEADIIETLNKYRDCIVHIESICWNGDAKIYHTKSYSGFVVSKDSGIYIVTVQNLLFYSDEEKEAIRKEFELENTDKLSEKIEIIFSGDLRISASVAGESEQRNLAILKLDQSVNFENSLEFTWKDASQGDAVYLLSYPEQGETDKPVYNIENVKITSGIMQDSYVADEITFQKHNIATDTSSLGGPLLNEDGAVAGVLLTSAADESGTAIGSEALKVFLDIYNISYHEREETVKEKKFPVLNIVLGVVIFALLILILFEKVKDSCSRKQEDRASSSRKVKPAEKKHTKHGVVEKKSQTTSPPSINAIASLEEPLEKRVVIISKSSFLIGRDPEADFLFQEQNGVSRRHACIRLEGGEYYLSDLQSRNHTFLNGLELKEKEQRLLKNGDEIMLGKVKLVFHRS